MASHTERTCYDCHRPLNHSWCCNDHCISYEAPLHPCKVQDCTLLTGRSHSLCRPHFTSKEWCMHCGTKFAAPMVCRVCFTTAICLAPDCKTEVTVKESYISRLCSEHAHLPRCKNEVNGHSRCNALLVDGWCPTCFDLVPCNVSRCTKLHPSTVSLCRDHYKAKKYCSCGTRLDQDGFCNLCSIVVDCAIITRKRDGCAAPCPFKTNKGKFCRSCWGVYNQIRRYQQTRCT